MEEQLSPLIPGGKPGRLLRNSGDHNHEPHDDPGTRPSSSQPTAGKPHGWKPVSLTTPFLLCTMALSVALMIVIEVLAQISRQHNGLAFYPSIQDIPAHTSFAYRYLPTIVATLYSFLWNWIDLDVKRVQPWIEVSKPGGMAAKDSLFVDYTTDFLAAAPVNAAKRRHWPVVFSGTSVVLILWILTPLQTSLFGLSGVHRNISAVVTQRDQLLPVDLQLDSPQPRISLNMIERFNMTYPPFTTSGYALLPFYLNDTSVERNWTAETTKMWAEVDCSPAQVTEKTYKSPQGGESINFTVDMFKGCSISLPFAVDSSSLMIYPPLVTKPLYPLPHLNRDTWDCPRPPRDQYSVLYYGVGPLEASSGKPKLNFTALQCNLSLHKARVRTTVGSYSLQAIAIDTLEKQEALGPEEFNITSYLYSSAGLYSERNETWEAIEFNTKSADCRGFCAYLTKGHGYNLTEYDSVGNVPRLEKIAESYHRSLFTLAVWSRLESQENPAPGPAVSTVFLTTIVISRTFSVMSEVLLLLAASSLGFIYYSTSFSVRLLSRTPSSIADLMDIAHRSPEMVKLLEPMDTADEKLLAHTAETISFQLTVDGSSMSNSLVVKQPEGEESDILYHAKRPQPYYEPIKPWILRRLTGSALVTVLVAGVAVLSCLKAIEQKEKGIQRPSESFEVLQLLENYIPTVFATGIEPLWILLTRTMCVFQPFKDLWKGHSKATRSVEATHTSVPPQLALFKAIASRHFVLSLLCLATLLANVLAIGLSALFIERPSAIQRPSRLDSLDNQDLISSNIEHLELDDTGFLDMIWANKTYGSNLPRWISKDFFFQPVTIDDRDRSRSVNEYTVRTMGFGTGANCTAIPVLTHRLRPWTEDDLGAIEDWERDTDILGKLPEIIDASAVASQLNRTEPASLAYAFMAPFESVRSGRCRPWLLFGWVKANDGVRGNATVRAGHAMCRPYLRTAVFEVTVARKGVIAGYHNVTDIQTRPTHQVPNDRNNLLLGGLNRQFEAFSPEWRNTSQTPDWMSHFISLDTSSRDFLDPKTDVPDASSLIPSIEKAYSQLFAAFLGVNGDLLEEREATILIDDRIFMDDLAFIITMTVLALDLVIALVFYLPETLYILPRPPSSVLSVMAYVVPSRAVQDGRPPGGWIEQTFSFGRYMGHDGKGHVGIEMDPHVRSKDTSLGSYKPLLQRDGDTGTV